MGNAILAPIEKNMDNVVLFHRFRYHLGSGFVMPFDTVLDLGCGTGYGSKILATKALNVHAFDMDEGNIKYAEDHKEFENITYQQANLEEMEIPEADVACSFEVIEHLYKPKEFVDKLKKQIWGYIIVSVPIDQKLIMVDGDPQEEGDSTHHSVFTQEEFDSMFIDDTWKKFWALQDGVTYIAVYYNNENI